MSNGHQEFIDIQNAAHIEAEEEAARDLQFYEIGTFAKKVENEFQDKTTQEMGQRVKAILDGRPGD